MARSPLHPNVLVMQELFRFQQTVALVVTHTWYFFIHREREKQQKKGGREEEDMECEIITICNSVLLFVCFSFPFFLFFLFFSFFFFLFFFFFLLFFKVDSGAYTSTTSYSLSAGTHTFFAKDSNGCTSVQGSVTFSAPIGKQA